MNIEDSIKILDKFITEHKLFNIKHSDGLEEAIETLLTAYEKEKNKELEELKDESKEYQIGFAQGCYEKDLDWKDKIKAKIEEYEEQEKDEPNAFLCKRVLQSLLEKE